MARDLQLAGDVINDANDCYLVAALGCNHMDDLEVGKEMFQGAKDCGADAVKMQKRDNKALFTKAMFDMPTRRPINSALGVSRLSGTQGAPPPSWEDALERYLKEKGWIGTGL